MAVTECQSSETKWVEILVLKPQEDKPITANDLSEKWIGRRGPFDCPACSPDFSPIDFFLGGGSTQGQSS